MDTYDELLNLHSELHIGTSGGLRGAVFARITPAQRIIRA